MRIMVTFSFAPDTGNSIVATGKINQVFEKLMQDLKPEAAYFYPETTAPMTDESTAHVEDLGWIKIGYNDAGSGNPPVFLLHGAGAGASSWSNFVLNFGPFSQHYRTLAMDQPGYAKSDPFVAQSEPRNTANARAVRDLMDKLGIGTDKQKGPGASAGPLLISAGSER